MPDWCNNKGSIELKDGVDVEKFIEKIGAKIDDDQFRFDYNKMIPVPDGGEFIAITRSTLWGCKWNDEPDKYNSGTKNFYDEGLEFYDFITPYGPPQRIMEFLWNMDEVEKIEWSFRIGHSDYDGLFKDGKWFEKEYIEVEIMDIEVEKEIIKQFLANMTKKKEAA